MSFFTPNRICTLLVVACVCFGFLLRLDFFDSTGSHFYFVDVARDYIVSHHMVAYGEVPLTGSDGYAGSYLSSPLYYYLLAFLLLFVNSVFFPGLVNVVLQTLCIILVFFLAKELFGRKTACLSVLFFTFFDAIIGQSFIMWQPYIMQPFLLGSLYLLAHAYKTKQNLAFYGSGILLACALLLHNSVLAIVPTYILAVGLILLKRKASRQTYLKTALSFFLPVVLMTLPVFIYFTFYQVEAVPLSSEEALYLVPGPALQLGIGSLAVSFVERFVYLFSFLFEGTITSLDQFTPSVFTIMIIGLFTVGSLLYVARRKESDRIYYFLFFLSCILLTSAAVATLGLLSKFEFPVRYFTPIYAMVLILVSEIIVSSFQQYKWTIIPKIALVALIFVYASPTLPASVESIFTRIYEKGSQAFDPVYTVPDDVLVLADTLRSLKTSGGVLPSFDVRTFKEDYEDQYLDSKVWFPLEDLLDTKLVKVDDSSFRGFAVPKTPDHMFVRCFSNTKTECEHSFLRKYSQKYKVVGTIQASSEVFYLHTVRI